jgi:hypothetical protein
VKSKIGTFDFVDGVLVHGLGVTPVQLTKMVQITVGQAAGVIAATIFIGKYPLRAATSELFSSRIKLAYGLRVALL